MNGFPKRINKHMADEEICSRREADELIKAGRVFINGTKSKLGDMVAAEDKVELKGDAKELIYIAYNKPVGVVTNCPQKGEKAIADILKIKQKVFPVGRLDKESRGLIILTNDGRITDRLLSPKNYHEKEYEVQVGRKLKESDLKRLRQGMVLEGGFITKKCQVRKINDYRFSIILTEGKNRQIRRMCAALGLDVIDLNRVRIMNLRLGSLLEGHYKILAGEKLEELLFELGLR